MSNPSIELRTGLPWDEVISWATSFVVGDTLRGAIIAAVRLGAALGMFYFKVKEQDVKVIFSMITSITNSLKGNPLLSLEHSITKQEIQIGVDQHQHNLS